MATKPEVQPAAPYRSIEPERETATPWSFYFMTAMLLLSLLFLLAMPFMM